MKILSTKQYAQRMNKVTEADNEKTFEVEYTVTYKKNMKGTSVGDVQNQIKNNNAGNQVSIRYAREIAPMTEDFGDEFLGEPENIGLDDLDIDMPKKEFAPDDDITPAPAGEDAAMVGLLNSLVVDELNAVNSYNGAVETIRSMPQGMPGANAAISVLSDISDEENSHIGEIQELLKQFTPQANAVEDGKNEARGIINNTPPSAPVTANDYALEIASDNFVVDDDISF